MGFVLKITSSFVVPLLLAVLLSFVLTPLIEGLGRLHIPRFVSILLVLVLLVAILYLAGMVVYASAQSFMKEFPKYQQQLGEIIHSIWVKYQLPQDLLEGFSWASTLTPQIMKISGSFVSFLKGLGLMILFLVFILSETTLSQAKLKKAFAATITRRIDTMVADIYAQISRYLTIKLIVSLITGLLTGGILHWIGLDFAVMWGVMAFVLNFIPNIGSFFVMVVVILFSFIQYYPVWPPILGVSAAVIAIQSVMGNFIDPKMQGNSLDLSPLLIIISLMFWGWLWGVIGMLIAVPMMVMIKIVFANFQGLYPFSVMMGTGKKPSYRPAHPPYRLFTRKKKGAPEAGTGSPESSGVPAEDRRDG